MHSQCILSCIVFIIHLLRFSLNCEADYQWPRLSKPFKSALKNKADLHRNDSAHRQCEPFRDGPWDQQGWEKFLALIWSKWDDVFGCFSWMIFGMSLWVVEEIECPYIPGNAMDLLHIYFCKKFGSCIDRPPKTVFAYHKLCRSLRFLFKKCAKL